jgi:hypothetical protein
MGNIGLSQDDEQIESSKLFVKSYFRLPNVTSNKFYKGVSRGISDAGVSLNYNVFKGIHLGLGFKHTFFEISQFKIVEDLDAQTHFYGTFLELSYIHNLTSNVFVEPSIQVGNNTMQTTSNPCRNAGIDKHVSNTTYYTPSLNFYIRGFDRIAYSFSVGYTITQSKFSPSTVCLDSFSGYSDQDFKNNIHHLNIGFGFLVYLGKLKIE